MALVTIHDGHGHKALGVGDVVDGKFTGIATTNEAFEGDITQGQAYLVDGFPEGSPAQGDTFTPGYTA